jgi:hypothetical protein
LVTSGGKKAAKQQVAAHLDVINFQRPSGSLLADRVLARAIEVHEVHGNRHRLPAELLSCRNALEKLLRSDIPDMTVRHGFKKSLSKDKNRNAAGLMLYEPHALKVEGRTLLGAYSYTVVLKPLFG